MSRLILPSLLLAVLAGGVCHAQGPQAPYGPFPRIHPGQTELPPGYPPVDNSPSPTPLRDYYRYGRPLGCWASFNGYSCTSLPATWTFMFGSCRDFFGEPCLKGPPPSPLPPYAEGDGGRMPPRPDAKAVRQEYRKNTTLFQRLLGRDGRDGAYSGGFGGLGCPSCGAR
jgi:hypothetical protein